MPLGSVTTNERRHAGNLRGKKEKKRAAGSRQRAAKNLDICARMLRFFCPLPAARCPLPAINDNRPNSASEQKVQHR
jgi:hypothetical protein